MVIDNLANLGVDVGLLFDALIDLLEKRLVNQLLEATNGKVRHKVLAVAEVPKAIESVEDIILEFI